MLSVLAPRASDAFIAPFEARLEPVTALSEPLDTLGAFRSFESFEPVSPLAPNAEPSPIAFATCMTPSIASGFPSMSPIMLP